MHKKILISLIVAAFAASSLAPAQAEQNLVDFHIERASNGCESCHENGEPSADGLYEFDQCRACHGTLDKMSGMHHRPHKNMYSCADCHAPHYNNVGEIPGCDDCHLDKRKSKSRRK
ncbi:cytochrome c3 family protein [Shewanella sp. WXL01]|uniref:cytochrome c3 family protein n=1 Tax=Shewanella sp. WXL01 TaxID=2709721 RepID=UPI0014382874|nr:cytochrome c3 family protein [Shewanella sp. WXL01]